jgi:hypothetical protein
VEITHEAAQRFKKSPGLLEEITNDPKARKIELAKRIGVTPAYANVLMKNEVVSDKELNMNTERS